MWGNVGNLAFHLIPDLLYIYFNSWRGVFALRAFFAETFRYMSHGTKDLDELLNAYEPLGVVKPWVQNLLICLSQMACNKSAISACQKSVVFAICQFVCLPTSDMTYHNAFLNPDLNRYKSDDQRAPRLQPSSYLTDIDP